MQRIRRKSQHFCHAAGAPLVVTLRCKQNGIGKAVFAQNIPRKTQVFKRRFGVYFRKDALRRNPELHQRFLCGFALALRLVLALPAGRDTNGFRIGF